MSAPTVADPPEGSATAADVTFLGDTPPGVFLELVLTPEGLLQFRHTEDVSRWPKTTADLARLVGQLRLVTMLLERWALAAVVQTQETHTKLAELMERATGNVRH